MSHKNILNNETLFMGFEIFFNEAYEKYKCELTTE